MLPSRILVLTFALLAVPTLSFLPMSSTTRMPSALPATPADSAREKLLREAGQAFKPVLDLVQTVTTPLQLEAGQAMKPVLDQVQAATAPLQQQLTSTAQPLEARVSQIAANLPPLPAPLALAVQELARIVDHVDLATSPLLVAPILLIGGQAVVNAAKAATADKAPYASGATTYDYRLADKFFGERGIFVASRAAELMRLTTAFNIRLLMDWRLGNLEKNEKERAKEALVLSSSLGPTFIKLGQALSIRTDLIPEAYALELRQLQDAVPPFKSELAREVLRRELGVKDLGEVFLTLSQEPVASASIGQVYRGTLLDGREVAVKVQRPGVLGEIALDLFLLRKLTPLQVKISNAVNKLSTSPEDIDTALALVDEWGRGFVAEVDYLSEAQKQKDFSAAMERRGLGAVTAPKVVDEYSSSRVLVTEWVQGTRLDKDASPDVPRLCGVAINAYLTMLLDTGCLHCDPHPGNLLRTTDGKLCILDWGMTLQVPNDLQYALIEFIAHINSEDYEAIPADFVNLGFTPPDQIDRVRSSGITEGLSFTLRQLSKGGGPKQIQERVKLELQERYGAGLDDAELRDRAREEMMSRFEEQLEAEGVDVSGVTNIMEEMSKRNRELFQLPPYVLYISRAFSTLEGIGLSIDENYSIVQECYPYLARRLLTDSSPRAKNALRSMLYGPETAPADVSTGVLAAREGVADATPSRRQGLLSPEKLVEMSEGFTSYTAATADANTGAGMEEAREALTELLLADQGNYVQEILIEEAAKIADALLRDRVGTALNAAVDAVAAPKAIVEANVPTFLRPLALPLTLPGTVAEAVKPVLIKSQEDEEVLAVARTLAGAFRNGGSNTAADSQQLLSADLLNPNSALWTSVFTPVSQNLPAVTTLTRKIGAALLGRVTDRLEQTTAQQVADGEITEEALRMRNLAQQALGPIAGALDNQQGTMPLQQPPPAVTPATFKQ